MGAVVATFDPCAFSVFNPLKVFSPAKVPESSGGVRAIAKLAASTIGLVEAVVPGVPAGVSSLSGACKATVSVIDAAKLPTDIQGVVTNVERKKPGISTVSKVCYATATFFGIISFIDKIKLISLDRIASAVSGMVVKGVGSVLGHATSVVYLTGVFFGLADRANKLAKLNQDLQAFDRERSRWTDMKAMYERDEDIRQVYDNVVTEKKDAQDKVENFFSGDKKFISNKLENRVSIVNTKIDNANKEKVKTWLGVAGDVMKAAMIVFGFAATLAGVGGVFGVTVALLSAGVATAAFSLYKSHFDEAHKEQAVPAKI